jgi:hypothetical protein
MIGAPESTLRGRAFMAGGTGGALPTSRPERYSSLADDFPISRSIVKRRTRRLLAVGVLGVIASAGSASAQAVRTLTVTSTVSDIGIVVAIAALVSYDTTQAGAIKVAGSVTTSHNGPYRLQVRLAKVVADTVLARVPDGSYSTVGSAWTTISTGPGGANLVNAVDFWIKRARNSLRRPQAAEAIAVSYRVVAP